MPMALPLAYRRQHSFDYYSYDAMRADTDAMHTPLKRNTTAEAY